MSVIRVVLGALLLTLTTTVPTLSKFNSHSPFDDDYEDYSPYVGQLLEYNASDESEILISFLAAVSRVPSNMGQILHGLSQSGASSDTSAALDKHQFTNVGKLGECFRTDFDGSMIAGALQVAIEEINDSKDILPNHKLRFVFENTCGDEKQSARYFMEHWKLGARAFIGPEINCRTEAQMAAAQNLPIISYKCKDQTVSNKHKYPTFTRTVPAETDITKAFIVLMREFKWSRFSIIYESTSQANTEMMNAIKKAIDEENKRTFEDDFRFQIRNVTVLEQFSEIGSEALIERIIAETRDQTRIYVTFGNVRLFRRILTAMGDWGLMDTQEHMLIYLDPDYNWLNKYHAMNNHFARNTMLDLTSSWRDKNSTDRRVAQYLRNALAIIPTPIDWNQTRFTDFWRKSNDYLVNFGVQKDSIASNWSIRINRFACYLYDAVYVYARALHSLIESTTEQQSRGYDPTRDGVSITNNIIGQTYDSMGGFRMTINQLGDAKGNYTLLAWQEVEPVYNASTADYYPLTHALDITAHFEEDGSGPPKLTFKKSMIWENGEVPRDQPDCGFEGERCRGSMVALAFGIGTVVTAILLFGGTFMVLLAFRTARYEKELERQWKLDISKILKIDEAKNVHGSNLSLLAAQKEFFDQSFFLSSARVINECAIYEQKTVLMKELQFRKPKDVTRSMKVEMKSLRSLNHLNVNAFVGLLTDYNKERDIIIVREFCGRSSLHDVLMNKDTRFGEMFSISFVDDLIRGMTYIHNSVVKTHGNLKSTNCLVTPRWVLKVGDFGLADLRRSKDRLFSDPEDYFHDKMWMAPEILRSHVFEEMQYDPTQKGDVYSFGIILHEIAFRHGPHNTLAPLPEGVEDAKRLKGEPLIRAIAYDGWRPACIQNEDWPGPELVDAITGTMRRCWDENPEARPDFRSQMRCSLSELFMKHKEKNVMENMLDMMEEYQNTLELKVFERTKQLHDEQQRSIALLERMLPRSIADQLLAGQAVKPELFPSVTIYFSDIVGFTSLASHSSPMEVVVLLNKLYTLFDKIIKQYAVYKVETIGDAYMVVSGLPTAHTPEFHYEQMGGYYHCEQIGLMALNLLAAMKNFTIPHRPGERLLLRIGIHTGSCVAGIVGSTMPRYCLFGDTVNVASRMESTGEPLKIHVSECTYSIMESKLKTFICEPRFNGTSGKMFIKGKGDMRTYWVLAHKFVTFEEIEDPKTNFDCSYVNREIFPQKGTYRPQIRESTSALNRDSTLSLIQRVRGSERGTPRSDFKDSAYYNSQNGMVSLNGSWRELGSVCEEGDSGHSTGHSGNSNPSLSTVRHGRRLFARRQSTLMYDPDKPALRKRSTSLPDAELLNNLLSVNDAPLETAVSATPISSIPAPYVRRSTDSRSLHSPSLPRSAYPSYKDMTDTVKRKGGRPLSVWRSRKRSLSMGDMVTVHMVPENLGRLKKPDAEIEYPTQRRRRRVFSKERKSVGSLRRDPSPLMRIRESSPFGRLFSSTSSCDSYCESYSNSERSGSRGESLSRLWNRFRNGSQNQYQGLNESDYDRDPNDIDGQEQAQEQGSSSSLPRRVVDSNTPENEGAGDDCVEPLIHPELMV